LVIIIRHGKDKLTEFLEHLNGLHKNIQFTMEIEEEGHLPFLDIHIYRKTDNSLGHKVYRKPTRTKLYLHPLSHHHPAKKHSVLSSLALCDQESLAHELEFLTTVFKNNGYNNSQIQQAMKPAIWTSESKDQLTATAYIPYTNNIYGRLSRMLAKHNIKSIAIPSRKISSYLPPVKDGIELKTPGVYRIPCECGMVYIGQSGRSIHQRIKEHERYI
jgi:hypothetical protein